jgi:hypothetical protein
MKPPADGWDEEERATLEMLDGDLEEVRARHQGDPPIEMLRAARADVLPDELLTSTVKSTSESEWGRALVEGLDTVDRPLGNDDEDRLLLRIRRAIAAGTRASSAWRWLRWATVAAVATLVIVVAVSRREVNVPTPDVGPGLQTPPSVQTPPSTPRFVLPLDKPEVKLSAAVLTFRGPTDDEFIDQLTKALDAFRADNYAEADRQLQALEKAHPVFDVYFYQGLSRLLSDDAAAALPPLRKAASLADRVFAPDVAWYTAVAEERTGQLTAARDRLADLCRTENPHRQQACEGQTQLDSALSVRPPS